MLASPLAGWKFFGDTWGLLRSNRWQRIVSGKREETENIPFDARRQGAWYTIQWNYNPCLFSFPFGPGPTQATLVEVPIPHCGITGGSFIMSNLNRALPLGQCFRKETGCSVSCSLCKLNQTESLCGTPHIGL